MRPDLVRYGAGLLLAAGVLFAIGAGSQWTIDASGEGALVRLSWRIEAVRVETCRTLTEAELAEIPAHMRQAQSCEGGAVDYELTLEVDGIIELIDTIAPSGLRRDRPVYVYHDQLVEPGERRVEVRFGPIVDEPSADTIPDHTWSGVLDLEARQIGLLTLTADGSRLERRTSTGVGGGG